MDMSSFVNGQMSICEYLYEILKTNGAEAVIDYITKVVGGNHAAP